MERLQYKKGGGGEMRTIRLRTSSINSLKIKETCSVG